MPKNIEQTKNGWEESVVMVCKSCDDQAERIKTELKEMAKSEFGKKVRVITTSCLGICPEKKIAISIASKKSSEVFSDILKV